MAKRIKDPGVGTSSDKKAKRFISLDGSFNIKHINKPKSLSASYSYLIEVSWVVFFLWVLLGYILVNTFFAGIYLMIGMSHITAPTGSIFYDFLNAFFFSAQTITTVGYGGMSPQGVLFGVVSSLEALVGLLSFSFVTGLLYGRFSKPRANIRFSDVLVLRKHKGIDSLMFRLMSRNTNVMIRPHIEVTLTLSTENEENKYVNNFYQLKLERSAITYLPTTWTVVHPINDKSPLIDYRREELSKLHGEILILVSYYDESFAQEVHQVHSYMLEDMRMDHIFEKAFYHEEEGYTVLDHNKLNRTYPDTRK
ncbi:ion transporter [Aquimarina sp. TRL1]|uniref:ion channel n=1 Tax=Aquimarina sp. (strain TRL1) TaxID=2736252 RepID=UPI00158EB488|nr:ion channel [Aquimarina sp. TRL1]QKX07485.1 ion transporter [Aquimarina sp. TRL1]